MDQSERTVEDEHRYNPESVHQRNQTAGSHSLLRSLSAAALWSKYCNFVQENRITLDLVDDVVTRLVFWTTPTYSVTSGGEDGEDTSWRREVLYGLLSLHRMASDIALEQCSAGEEQYGMTLRIDPTGESLRLSEGTPTSIVTATTIRISLSILQGLLPTILELASCSRDYRRRQRYAYARLFVERFKFALRLCSLCAYWYETHRQEGSLDLVGLMRDGGLYVPPLHQLPSMHDIIRQRERRQYVGKRTGRRVAAEPPCSQATQQAFQTVLGELLYIARPLYWASVEHRKRTASKYDWTLSFLMDVGSLLLLRRHPSKEELSRRKMRLLLYLLRSPVWNQYTEPAAERVGAVACRFPLVGGLLETYLWEALYHWKHPFASEQG